jgi:predicted phosphodiesterase
VGIDLPKQFNSELHLARATSELPRIKKLIGGDIGIGSTQGVVHCSQDYAGLEDTRLRQSEIAMVEHIHRVNAELKTGMLVANPGTATWTVYIPVSRFGKT